MDPAGTKHPNSNYYTGTSTYAYTSGSSATYAFSGRSVKWYGVAGPDHGLADVYIDGAIVKTVDCYAQYWSANTPLFYQAGLAAGNHTLVITAKGQHSSSASANYVEVDALESANGIPAVTDDRNGVAYTGSWSQTSNNAYANGTGTFSTTAGSTATFGFTGTSVRWYGVVGPDHGKADVYIDNVLIRTSDSYDPTWSANALLFAAGALSNAPHTLKIVVRGDRNSMSSNNYLEVRFNGSRMMLSSGGTTRLPKDAFHRLEIRHSRSVVGQQIAAFSPLVPRVERHNTLFGWPGFNPISCAK